MFVDPTGWSETIECASGAWSACATTTPVSSRPAAPCPCAGTATQSSAATTIVARDRVGIGVRYAAAAPIVRPFSVTPSGLAGRFQQCDFSISPTCISGSGSSSAPLPRVSINGSGTSRSRSRARSIASSNFASDMVLIAGDVLHTVRLTNPAILHAFAQFSRLMRELPDVIVVIVAGNHDMPRSSETLCILRLFSPLGIHIVDGEPRRLSFPEHGLSILAVPALNAEEIAVEADPAARFNILVAHGDVKGRDESFAARVDPASLLLRREDLADPAWDYVALGHIHTYEKVGPKAFYSGSLDYASSNVWGEVQDRAAQEASGQGFDRARSRNREADVPSASRHARVPRPAADRRPGTLRDRSRRRNRGGRGATSRGIDGKVLVRLVAFDVPRHIARELDHKTLREFQRRALHFQLDTRRPEVQRTSASGAPGRRPSLAEMLRDSLRNRVLTTDIDRDRLVDLGAHYLREAEQFGTARDLIASAEEL